MTFEFVQFLNDKMIELLPSFRREGNKLHGRCFCCGDSHKSERKMRGWVYLGVNNKPPSYYCFNCGTNLTAFQLIEQLTGKKYEEVKEEFLREYLKKGGSLSSFIQDTSLSSNEPENKINIFNVKKILDDKYKSPLTDKAKKYLEDRMVLDAPYLSDKLYSFISPKKNEEYILIPWTLNGIEGAYYQINDFQKLHGIKYRFPKDSQKLIYGLDNVDVSWPYIIIFEGVYDSLFVPNAIATGTKAITDVQYKLIKERYPRHQLVCSFDNDLPGLCAMKKMISKHREMKYFRWFNKNTQQKDINDFILAKDNPNLFTDLKMVEKMIISPAQMKLWMIGNGCWDIQEKR